MFLSTNRQADAEYFGMMFVIETFQVLRTLTFRKGVYSMDMINGLLLVHKYMPWQTVREIYDLSFLYFLPNLVNLATLQLVHMAATNQEG